MLDYNNISQNKIIKMDEFKGYGSSAIISDLRSPQTTHDESYDQINGKDCLLEQAYGGGMFGCCGGGGLFSKWKKSKNVHRAFKSDRPI